MNAKNSISQELRDGLKELRLPTIRHCYEEAARGAENESLTYEEFLLTLVQRERENRRQNREERYLRISRLPVGKTKDSLEIKRFPPKVRHRIKALLSGYFIDKHENVLIFGNPGSGKTHIASAIGHELIYKSRKVYYVSCSKLVQDLLIAKRDLRLSKYIKKLLGFSAVIIDDIGYVQQSREEMEVLFTFLAERYERGSVIITSNLPFSQWEKVFKDPMTAAAAIDRLVHHCTILELNLPSYRLECAKKLGLIDLESNNKGGEKTTDA